MRWGFIVDITNVRDSITSIVRAQAQSAASTLNPGSNNLFRVEITFYQSKDRYLKNDPEKPREDRGDIDNLVKQVFDGLGPIIGFRSSWDKIDGKWKEKKSKKPADSQIIELLAKKVNSGSTNELVSVEIESI